MELGVNTGLCICSHLFSLGPFKAQLLEFRFFHLRIPFLARFYCTNGSHSAFLLGKWGLSRVLHWLQTTYAAKNDLNLPSTRIKGTHAAAGARGSRLWAQGYMPARQEMQRRNEASSMEFSFSQPCLGFPVACSTRVVYRPSPMTDYLNYLKYLHWLFEATQLLLAGSLWSP